MPKHLPNDYTPPAHSERVVFRARQQFVPPLFFTVENCRITDAPHAYRQTFAQRWADVREQLIQDGYEIEEMSRSRKVGWSAGMKARRGQ